MNSLGTSQNVHNEDILNSVLSTAAAFDDSLDFWSERYFLIIQINDDTIVPTKNGQRLMYVLCLERANHQIPLEP